MNFHPSLPSSYEYIHYTGENLDALDLNRTYPQTAEKLAFHTPNGLWLSITGKNDWEQYCLKNNYNLHNLKYELQVKLKPYANILILYNDAAYADFAKNYTLNLSVRWEDIIKDYQGLALPHVTPQSYNAGLRHDTWSCTSACIWDLQAVSKVEKIDNK